MNEDRIPDFKDVRHPNPGAPPRKPTKAEIAALIKDIVESLRKNDKRTLYDG